MISRIYTVNSERFTLCYPEKLVPIWSKKNHICFSAAFKIRCFTLLCIQKHIRYMDKNIFLSIMQKISRSNFHPIDFEKYPVYKLLQYMKNDDVDIIKDLSNKVVLKNLIITTLYRESRDTEIFPQDMMGIIEVGVNSLFSHINFSVLKNAKAQTLVIHLRFNPFSYKKSSWIKRLSESFDHIMNEKNTFIKRQEIYRMKKINRSRRETCYAILGLISILVILSLLYSFY